MKNITPNLTGEEIINGWIVKVHPIANIFPMMSVDEFEGLKADINENGMHEPLLFWNDQLIDGRNRLKACIELGKQSHIESCELEPDTDPVPWVLSNNLHRRHLTASQRAIVAAEIASLTRGGDRKSENIKVQICTSIDAAAKTLNVSPRSVKSAKKVLASGDETVIAAVKTGEMKVSAAAELVKAKPKKPPTVTSTFVTNIVTAKGVVTEITRPSKVMFNATTDAVDWAKWTWNPITGCEHGCGFCYAREIALSQRMAPYYPNGFEPTFHEYRLEAPKNTKRPTDDDARSGRVFVCSMADLFGKWVPKEWIEKVFNACLESPEWEYLFLTKWPSRYTTMPLIKRAWYGASVIQQTDVSRVEKAMQKIEDPDVVCWISLEPMLGPIKFDDLSWCDLVVIGSQTSTNQPDGPVPAFAPEFDWIVDVVNQCRAAGVPYYLKANLGMESPGMKLPKSNPRRS